MSLFAIVLNGANCRLRRIRLINFGTRTPQRNNGVYDTGSYEAFPFFCSGDDLVIEECIIEQPFRGCARETTIIIPSGKSCAVRNNYINCAFVNPSNGLPTAIESISSFGTTVTVETRFPHNVCASRPYSGGGPDYVEIKGATPSSYNARWPVTSPALEDPLSRVLTFEMASPPGAGSAGTVEQSFLPTMRITSAVVSGIAPNPKPTIRKQRLAGRHPPMLFIDQTRIPATRSL